MEDDKGQLTKTALIALGISATLIFLIILQHNLAFRKSSTIVLPAGGTYLGPSLSPEARALGGSQSTSPAPVAATASQEGYVTVKGNKYPYSFEALSTLKLVTFPNDAFDIYAIAWENQPPENNVLIGVDDLNRTEELKKYVKGTKRAYVENWWKQFGGLKGVASITEFINSKGLKGYKAKYTNAAGVAPTDDIFFETSDPTFVIHLGNGSLDKTVFDRIVNSVEWKK